MFKKILFYFTIFLFNFLGQSQEVQLSPLSKISLLTVGTGDDLAAKFGHSAIRLQDPSIGIDEVYGYGTYDFEDPNFYLNFTRGKLAYTISRIPYSYFERSYKQEQRWVKEQSLNLNLQQRNAIIGFLEHNLLPENKRYKYDFLFDNCATRIPMVFEKTLGNELHFNFDHLSEHLTFRQLIRLKLNPNSWSNFGIDLALGSVIDRKATPYEHLFLPIYVYRQMKHTTLNGEPFVKKETVLLDIPEQDDSSIFVFSPAFWLGLLLVLVSWITYRDHSKGERTKWLDFSLFILTGLSGILIAFLWFGTDHLATKMNYNALWAFAPNAIVALYLLKNDPPKWINTYLIIVMILVLISILIWILKIQVFSILMILVLGVLSIRYIFLYSFFKTVQKTKTN
ncbi:lipoprotein N-acyltransferase Lnb domain-containing protein [Maribacter confluentis]|uniref:lipoprotein N-acyltransferase Lnb domain-containing protein n=1 Tax=Maribacter confluentis TaxID=1656093 RepID=UPI00361E243F